MKKVIKIISLGSLLFVPLVAFAGTPVTNLLDTTTNQPTWLIGTDATYLYSPPGGFSCDVSFSPAHCETAIAWIVGDNLFKSYVTGNNLTAFPTGTYTVVRTNNGNVCQAGVTLATCQGLAASTYQTFTITSGGVSSTASTTINTPDQVFNFIAYDVVYSIIAIIIVGIFVSISRGW